MYTIVINNSNHFPLIQLVDVQHMNQPLPMLIVDDMTK